MACARCTSLLYDRVANVVSMAKSQPFNSSSSIRSNINLPASIAIPSGLNGESPRAISSAFTNSFTFSISGSTVYEAVVFPAPLQPLMIYKCLLIASKYTTISAYIYIAFHFLRKLAVFVLLCPYFRPLLLSKGHCLRCV